MHTSQAVPITLNIRVVPLWVWLLVCPAGMMNAVSGDKAPDKSQGELTGLLKAMGYTADQVYKF